ncbi:peptide chain release factor N(5)-glutamine methyltransferase [Patescibacteria group bacterium]|nr:peptide chain release factor N(5)-glutamine methyltransferase [Patescibacteria group bacterium]
MTIQKTLLTAINKLRQASITSATLDAEILLSHVLKRSKEYLLSYPEKKISANLSRTYKSLILRRQRGLPTAYLTNNKEFYGLNFFVNQHVLIPRPATETIVEEAIKEVRQLQLADKAKKIIIADVGTGSGCIAVTLAKYLKNVRLYAIDISSSALTVAKKNAQSHKVSSKISFVAGNLLTAIKITKKNPAIDLIVANLPYLTKYELSAVRYEPKLALLGGKMGLEYIDQLIAQVPRVLADDGVILLEVSPTQVTVVEHVAKQHFPDKNISFIKDLSGQERVVKIK